MSKHTSSVSAACLLPAGLLLAAVFLLSFPLLVRAGAPAQIPTGSIPTVTGTPVGAIAVILENEQGYVNVRSGPSAMSSVYPIIGIITTGSSVPAIGRSPGGDWIKIAYPGAPDGVGWVYSDLVDVRGRVPVVELPPTPTPATTATIDPTLAAQFLVEVPPTRLPTFTAPPPVVAPTMPSDVGSTTNPSPVPMVLVIAAMLVIGFTGLLISFFRSR
jgi:hypothetical protein